MISQNALDLSYFALNLAAGASMFLYAPFAKTWRRALLIQSIIAIAWAVLRLMADIYYDEDPGPGIFYIIVPVEWLLFASLARAIKKFVFRIPLLRNAEDALRSRFR